MILVAEDIKVVVKDWFGKMRPFPVKTDGKVVTRARWIVKDATSDDSGPLFLDTVNFCIGTYIGAIFEIEGKIPRTFIFRIQERPSKTLYLPAAGSFESKHDSFRLLVSSPPYSCMPIFVTKSPEIDENIQRILRKIRGLTKSMPELTCNICEEDVDTYVRANFTMHMLNSMVGGKKIKHL